MTREGGTGAEPYGQCAEPSQAIWTTGMTLDQKWRLTRDKETLILGVEREMHCAFADIMANVAKSRVAKLRNTR